MNNIFNENPDLERFEIYHLAAQSHVKISFEIPEYTTSVDALGTLALLEIIKTLPDNRKEKTRFYQAGTSEMFGDIIESVQNESTPFRPQSPYACAKVYAHYIVRNYRESYNMFACNGILFNHESPVRGETFVTRKIVIALCKIKLGLQKKLYLGNLNSKRDWGHAKDYVIAMWKILQKNKPTDYVISTGKQYTVQQFVNFVLKELNIKFFWKGKGVNCKCYNENNEVIVECDKEYFRPLEVDTLLGDSRKALKDLKWKPKFKIKDLVKDMVRSELTNLTK